MITFTAGDRVRYDGELPLDAGTGELASGQEGTVTEVAADMSGHQIVTVRFNGGLTQDIPASELTEAAARHEADGPAPAAKATASCYICGKGIYQCGHERDGNGIYRPLWLHVDGPAPGMRECGDFPGAYATPR
jgi:hypothetical protein